MMGMIARIDAARCQIDRAVTAYFEDDLVSVLTLAGAAERVLSDLQRQDGLFGVDAYCWRSMINLDIKSEHQKEAVKIFRKDYDQLRHADYSESETIEINEKMVGQYIFMAILAANFLTKSMTKNISIYQLWYTLHHPHLIKKGTKFAAKLERAGPVPEGMTKQELYRLGQSFSPNEPRDSGQPPRSSGGIALDAARGLASMAATRRSSGVERHFQLKRQPRVERLFRRIRLKSSVSAAGRDRGRR